MNGEGGGCTLVKETVPNGHGREWWGSSTGLGQCMGQCIVYSNAWVEVGQRRVEHQSRGGEEWAVTHPGNGGDQKGPKKLPHHCCL